MLLFLIDPHDSNETNGAYIHRIKYKGQFLKYV